MRICPMMFSIPLIANPLKNWRTRHESDGHSDHWEISVMRHSDFRFAPIPTVRRLRDRVKTCRSTSDRTRYSSGVDASSVRSLLTTLLPLTVAAINHGKPRSMRES